MKNFSALSQQQKMLTLAVALTMIVIAGAAIFIVPKLLSDANNKSVGEAASAEAVAQADVLNKVVEQWQAALEQQSREAVVAESLQSAPLELLLAAEEKLRANNAEAGVIRVQLIAYGSNYSALGLRFSQLDRLSAMEKGQAVFPEAFDEGGKKLFDMFIPVKDAAGNTKGYFLVVFDSRIFEKGFSGVKPETGDVVIQQKFSTGSGQMVFRTRESKNLDRVSAPAESKVPHWKVLLVPGTKMVEENSVSAIWQYAAQLTAVGICLLVLYQVNRRATVVAKKIEAEHTTPIQIKGARKIDRSDIVNTPVSKEEEDAGFSDPLFQLGDVFDLDLDDDALDIKATTPKSMQPASVPMGSENFSVSPEIFRDYDIRGNADKDISDELAVRIGQAFGSECIEKGQQNVVLAGDGRISTPRLKYAVQQGLQAAGCNVVDIGIVPTPLMNFATHTLDGVKSGIMVTASHNHSADNGFKMVIDGHTLASEDIQRIKDRVQSGGFCEGEGEYREQDIIDDYIENIVSDIVLAGSYKVVVDCGNGVAGEVIPRLLEELGCEVVQLYCDIDGNFPNHAPDPSVMENLNDLIEAVANETADLGIAFDGDGDRLAVVTASGEIILPDCLLMLFARDVVSRNPGTDIVFDVKSTRRLNALISSCGGRPVMWKSGHSHIKNKMLETGAMLGGELSGHIFFKERWFGFDDGMYSAARLLEIMSIRDQDLDSIFSALPTAASTPEIRIEVSEDTKFAIVKSLAENGEWGNGKVTNIDGVRVDFAKGWGLVRASNTSAALSLRFEADDGDSLATVQHVFKQQLQKVDSGLRLPF